MLDQSSPKLQKIGERAKGLLEKGQVDAYVNLIDSEGVKLAGLLCLFASAEKPQAEKSLTFLALGDPQIARARFEKYSGLANARIEENVQLANQFETRASEIIGQIADASSPGEDSPGDAGSAMQSLIEQWSAASAALNQPHAIGVAFGPAGTRLGGGATKGAMETELTRLNQTAIRSMVLLIEAVTLVRFADLPADASTIQAFGTTPDLGNRNHAPMRATCWPLDIQPTWAQHRYFVVKLEVFVGPLSQLTVDSVNRGQLLRNRGTIGTMVLQSLRPVVGGGFGEVGCFGVFLDVST